MLRTPAAVLIAAAGLALAGCAGAGGPPVGAAAPLPVIRAAQSSLGAAAARASATSPRRGTRSVRRRSAVAPNTSTLWPTPAAPRRRQAAQAAIALPATAAARLAAPACAQHAAALAGSFPDAVLERGSARALALVGESVAAALLGLPVHAPAASLPARERLDRGRAWLAGALAAQDNGESTAATRSIASRIRAYAHALGIRDCG